MWLGVLAPAIFEGRVAAVSRTGRLAHPLVVIAVLVASFAAVVGAASSARAADEIAFFTTPSKSIGCVYDGSTPMLRCDVLNIQHPAKRPASCKLDYGSAFGLERHGRAKRLCVGDTALDPHAKVLEYGKSRRFGPFTCTSRPTGLRCTSPSKHGFVLSREHQRLF